MSKNNEAIFQKLLTNACNELERDTVYLLLFGANKLVEKDDYKYISKLLVETGEMENVTSLEEFIKLEKNVDFDLENNETLLLSVLKDDTIKQATLKKILGERYEEIIKDVNEILENDNNPKYNTKTAFEIGFSSLIYFIKPLVAEEKGLVEKLEQIESRHEEITKMLLEKSSLPEKMLQDKNCWNFVMIDACEKDNLERIKDLLEQAEKTKNISSSFEKLEKFYEFMRSELSKNNNIQELELLNKPFSQAKKPFEKAQLFLDIKSEEGSKLLNIACRKGYVEQIKFWIEKGVSVNNAGAYFDAPLTEVLSHYRISNENKSKIIEILLKTPGIKLNSKILTSFADNGEDKIITKDIEEAFLNAHIGKTQLQGSFVFESIFHHSNNFKIFELFIKKGAPITTNIIESKKDNKFLDLVKKNAEILNNTEKDFYKFCEALSQFEISEDLLDLLTPRLLEKLSNSSHQNNLEEYKEKILNLSDNKEFKESIKFIFKNYESKLEQEKNEFQEKIFIEKQEEANSLFVKENEDSNIMGSIIVETIDTDNN